MSRLYRIISGVVRTKHLVTTAPSLSVLLESEEVKEKSYDNAFEKGCLTENDLSKILVENEILPEDYEIQYKQLTSRMEGLKIRYFDNFIKTTKRKEISQEIESCEFSLILINQAKAKYRQMTCEGIAETTKDLFILKNTTFDHNNNPYNWEHISLTQLKNYIDYLTLDEEEMRDLSISGEWRSLWNIRSESPIFSKKVYELTNEQKTLIFWSKFYDSIYESPESPSGEIIKDRYAIDGWVLKKKRESSSNDLSDKHGDAQEIYSIARTPEDLENIRNLNSEQSQSIKEKQFRGK